MQLLQNCLMELSAQTVALHRPLVDLGADHNPASPGAGQVLVGTGGDQPALGGHPTQHHGFAMDGSPPFVQGVKHALAPQPVSVGQGQGLRPPDGRDRGGGGP